MKTIDCVPCAGTGQIEDTASVDHVRTYVRCGACAGSGQVSWPTVKVFDANCYWCAGSGITMAEQGVTFGGKECTFCVRTEYAAIVSAEDECKKYLMEVAQNIQTYSLNWEERTDHHTPEQVAAYFGVPMPMSNDDIELTTRALKACGYRVHIKERAGTRWVTAVKGLDVQYKHWHPLTNINQAMQLLIDAPKPLEMAVTQQAVWLCRHYACKTAAELINAQCRAIVTACASMEPVR